MTKPGTIALFSKLTKSSEKNERADSERCDALMSACESLERKSEELSAAIKNTDEIAGRISASLSDMASSGDAAEGIRRALLAEFEMLYEVFMSASLPQYEKDRIGERFAGVLPFRRRH